MQSLRTRRPSDGPPKSSKPQQQPQKLAKTPSRRAGGAARKSRVDDKIKKRMSMRYADISAPTAVSGVPEMPALPVSLIPGRRGAGGAGVGGVGGGVTGARAGRSESLGEESGDVVKGIVGTDGNEVEVDVTITSGGPPKPNQPLRFLDDSVRVEAADSTEREKAEVGACVVVELSELRVGISSGPELDSAAGSSAKSRA